MGAGYLIWLGVTSLGFLRRRPGLGLRSTAPSAPAVSVRGAYLNGVLTNLFNPKIGVFFIALLPGFIPAGQSTGSFSLALGLWFVVETGLWLCAVVWMVSRGVGWLRRSSVQRWIERATRVVLIGLGVRLATEAR